MAFTLDFTIPTCHAPWGGDQDVAEFNVYGEDLSAAAFKWVFYDPATGTAKMTLNTAAAGSEGLSASYDATVIDPESGAVTGMTRVLPQIAEATLEALTYSGVTDLVLDHTLFVTPTAKLQYAFCCGTLTIKQGAPD